MPVYRIPKTGEVFFQASGLAPRFTWTADSDPSMSFALRAHRKRRPAHNSKKRTNELHPAPVTAPRTLGGKRKADGGNPAVRMPEVTHFRPPRGTLSTAGAGGLPNSSLFAAPLPRKSVTGGEVKAIAFYTTNDPKNSPFWKRYAQVLVNKGKGHAYGVSGQNAAIKILDALTNTDISQVFLVGHGYAAKGDLKPAFMFSGQVEGEGFYAHGDNDMLLNSESYPFMRALIAHLSRDRMVTMSLLSCHSGADTRLQKELAGIVHSAAPEVEITVEGYREYFMIKQDMNSSPRAHLQEDKRSKAKKFDDTTAPDIPPGALRFTYDDPLRSVAADMSDDPISGIEDML
jgi:hypothetical protein